MSTLYGQMAINLGIVLGVALILLLVLKRLRSHSPLRSQPIKLLNTLHLGSKEKIALIEVNNTVLVLGITSNQINQLHQFPVTIGEFDSLLQKTRETVSD